VPVPGRGAAPGLDPGRPGPVGDDAGGAAMRLPAASWKAPRCESALLTASGDTGGAGAVASSGPGGPDAVLPSPPTGFDDGDGTAGPAGGGPYGDPTARDEGDAVAANGFTGAATPPAGTGGP
jgi:hypothetical protein